MRVAIDGDALRTLRQLRGLSPTSLAGAVGVTEGTIRHLETGRRASVRGEVFAELVDALDIGARPDWIADVTQHTALSPCLRLRLSPSLGNVLGAGENTNTPAAA